MDDEWRTREVLVDCTETGCLRAPVLSNTDTWYKITWRKVSAPIPISSETIMIGNSVFAIKKFKQAQIHSKNLPEGTKLNELDKKTPRNFPGG